MKKFNESNSSGSASSYKWISVAQTRGRPELTVNSEVNRLVFRPIGKNKCNLISVFGAARQGKSFLMNCLAGETDLFKISNQRESCTQGIDISQRLLPLSAFSSLHGGRAVNHDCNIGFVDAEGQGDKDVTYDANLICPILLVSKCVIFNWKDSMQKDKILNQLGILHKAAINVALEDEDIGGDSGHKLFGHLHLVFRDWQYEGSDEKSVLNDIFKEERSTETSAAVRNQIRRSVKENFESISVWLFPAPVGESAQLSKVLSYEITQSSFKQQLASLRSKLSSQLTKPTVFSGQPLHGSSIGSIVETIVNVLNTGDSIRPKPAWVSMMCSEIEHCRVEFENLLRKESDSFAKGYEELAICSIGNASMPSRRLSTSALEGARAAPARGAGASQRSSLPASSRPAEKSMDELVTTHFPDRQVVEEHFRNAVKRLYSEYRAEVDVIAGVRESDSFPSTLSSEEFSALECAVARSIEAERVYFSSRYNHICGLWIRAARDACIELLSSECTELQLHMPYLESDLNDATEKFFNDLSLVLRYRLERISSYERNIASIASLKEGGTAKKKAVPATSPSNMSEMIDSLKTDGVQDEKVGIEEALRSLRHAADMQFEIVRRANSESKRKSEEACRHCLTDAQKLLKRTVKERTAALKQSVTGVNCSEYKAILNRQFKEISDALWANVIALPMGHEFAEKLIKELEHSGYELAPEVDETFNEAMEQHMSRIAENARKMILSKTQHFLDSNTPISDAELRERFQAIADDVLNKNFPFIIGWISDTSDQCRRDLFEEPVRLLAEERLTSLRLMNQRMLDAAAREAALLQASIYEEEKRATKKTSSVATARRKRVSRGSSDDEIPETNRNTKRRATKKFASEEEENEYDMDISNEDFQQESTQTKSAPKGRRGTRKFESEAEEQQYDMDMNASSSFSGEAQSAPSSSRLPPDRNSVDDQKRRAREWALSQKKGKTPVKPSRPATPPLAGSDDESGVTGPPIRNKNKSKVPVQKMTKDDIIQVAKEKARLDMEKRQDERIRQLEEEAAAEANLNVTNARRSSVKSAGGRKSTTGTH